MKSIDMVFGERYKRQTFSLDDVRHHPTFATTCYMRDYEKMLLLVARLLSLAEAKLKRIEFSSSIDLHA